MELWINQCGEIPFIINYGTKYLSFNAKANYLKLIIIGLNRKLNLLKEIEKKYTAFCHALWQWELDLKIVCVVFRAVHLPLLIT